MCPCSSPAPSGWAGGIQKQSPWMARCQAWHRGADGPAGSRADMLRACCAERARSPLHCTEATGGRILTGSQDGHTGHRIKAGPCSTGPRTGVSWSPQAETVFPSPCFCLPLQHDRISRKVVIRSWRAEQLSTVPPKHHQGACPLGKAHSWKGRPAQSLSQPQIASKLLSGPQPLCAQGPGQP